MIKLKVKGLEYNEKYNEKLKAYKKQLALYKEEEERSKTLNIDIVSEEPEPPYPDENYIDFCFRENLLIGYQVDANRTEIKVFLDAMKLIDPVLLIDYDDKIIQRFDDILK